MRKIIFLLLAMFISIGAFSKDRNPSYFETHDPSPDSLMAGFNLETDGGVYTIVGVDSVSGLSAEQLFTKAKSWIGEIYNEPKAVIKSEINPNQLVFEGQLNRKFSGRVVFKFKDGRYRVEISGITIYGMTVETRPRYALSRMPRSGKWLLADMFEYFQMLKKAMHNVEADW